MSLTHAIVLVEVERDAMPTFGAILADLEGVHEAWSVTGYLLRSRGNVTLFSLNEPRHHVDRIHVVERAARCR